MIRAVIDTNVLVSRFLSLAGIPAMIFGLLDAKVFEFLVSPAILEEYRRVLLYGHIARRHGFSRSDVERIVVALGQQASIVQPQRALAVITQDLSDNKFLECALEGNAGYIVSGDTHLLRLGRYQGIEILSPADFLTVVQREKDGG